MECQIKDCVNCEDCGYLDIFKKQPEKGKQCSYFKSEKEVKKLLKKEEHQKAEFESKKHKPKFDRRKKKE